MNPGKPFRLYYLINENKEEKEYNSMLERESKIFESLKCEKEMLIVPKGLE